MHRFRTVRKRYFAAILSLLCCAGANAQIKSERDATSAHILTIAKNTPDPKIPVESVTGFEGKTSLVRNHAKTFRAYILCIPSKAKVKSCAARVYFTDDKAKVTYVTTGETEAVEQARPVDSLKWLDNDQLSYERWMNPHFGHRYVINVRQKKQVAAYTVSDVVNDTKKK